MITSAILRESILHGDVERGLRSIYEVDNHLFEVVGRTKLSGTEVDVDPAVGEALH